MNSTDLSQRRLSRLTLASPRLMLLFSLFSVQALSAQEGEGYRLLFNQVRVDRPVHWRAWDAPTGVQVVHADGTVEPRFLRRVIEVAQDAPDFTYISTFASEDTLQGGIYAVGTSQRQASFVLDGNPNTYWEPQRTSSLDHWFLEIDLGRAVIAHRVVLRFVAAGQGDPFLKFRVMASDGLRWGQGRDQRRRFFRVGLETTPNKDQREYIFDIAPDRQVPQGVEGEIVQFLRIDVLDTDGPRAEEVSAGTYAFLAEEDRGAIDYFRVTAAGREILVAERDYFDLPGEERGPVRYYRHERPRLAEVEVYSLGQNAVQLALSEIERGADERGFDFLFRRIFSDGLYSSSFRVPLYDPVLDEGQLKIDLGAKYWLDRIKLLAPADEMPPLAYQLRLSDGALSPNGERIWTTFGEQRNLSSYQHLEETFPLQEVRFIEVRHLEYNPNEQVEGYLSEIQAYGEGFVSEVEMTSPFIPLDRPRLFSAVEWEGQQPPGTRIEVRTRSGEEIVEVPHYYSTIGREISKAMWEVLSENRRPPVVIEQVAGPSWSNWSEVYEASGMPFKSPSPRAFVQVQVRLRSREPLRAARVRDLRLRFEPPLVDKMVGEIWPVWQVEPGVEQDFVLYLRPEFAAGNLGFDRLRLYSSSAAPIELLSVRSGGDTALRVGAGRQLWPGELVLEQGTEGKVELVFPEPVARGSPTYEIKFRTKVFLQSTTFTAELEQVSQPGRVQLVSDGDASSLVSSQSLVVVSDLERTRLLKDVAVVPKVFTPNGDGINDHTDIELSIFHLEGAKQLRVDIYDLSGRRVRDLSRGTEHPSGERRVEWDGRDEVGAVVAPGIYLVRVGFAADSGATGTHAARLVHVAY